MLCLIWQRCKGAAAGFWQGLCGDAAGLADRVKKLEEQLAAIMEHGGGHGPKETDDPLIIEQLHVDQIKVGKIEYHNNFGSLGIKELSGMLNIGANYGVDGGPLGQKNGKNAIAQAAAARLQSKSPGPGAKTPNGPKCNIIYK